MTKDIGVVNETHEDITLKRGSAGVFTTVAQLRPGHSLTMRVDEKNFVEWACVMNFANDEVRFNSDDCIKCQRIRILRAEDATLTWEGERRPGEQIDVHPSDADELGKEVYTLLKMRENPGFSTAVKNFERREEYFGVQIERKLTRKAELNTDIFNIVGFFSVYQGVVLNAVSLLKSDSYSTCGVIPFPIILSCLGALVGIAALLSKFASLHDLEYVISEDQKALTVS